MTSTYASGAEVAGCTRSSQVSLSWKLDVATRLDWPYCNKASQILLCKVSPHFNPPKRSTSGHSLSHFHPSRGPRIYSRKLKISTRPPRPPGHAHVRINILSTQLASNNILETYLPQEAACYIHFRLPPEAPMLSLNFLDLSPSAVFYRKHFVFGSF